MKRTHIAISLLLAGTAMQAQAREPALQDVPVPISVFNADDPANMAEGDFLNNLDRLKDINQACVVDRADPVYGRNVTGGIIDPVNIRGLESEYGTRYGAALATPTGQYLTIDALKQIELLHRPDVFTCNKGSSYPGADSPPALSTQAPTLVDPALTSPSQPIDPKLAVQPLPPEVQSGRYLPRAADIRAELDGLAKLCFNATAEDGPALKERYERQFGQLRELKAIQSDLRERLLTNDPTLDTQDALDQLKKLDPAIDGAIFPSQLKCPPTLAERMLSQEVYLSLQNDYSQELATDYLINQFNDASGTDGSNVPAVEHRGRLVSDHGIKLRVEGPYESEDPGVEVRTWPSISGNFGQLAVGDGSTGVGFQSTGPGTETFADTAPTKFDSAGISAALQFKLSDGLSGALQYSYSEGDARSDFDIPPGGAIDVGNVYGGESPSGSTGLNIGNRGLSGFNEADFNLHEIKFSATTAIATEGGFASTATLFINALFMDRNFKGETNATVFGTPITQSRDQNVQDRLFGMGVLLNGRMPISKGVSLTGSVAGGVYYRDTDMDATEWNMCGLCPPADQNFTLTFVEGDSGASFAGSVAGGLEFDISPDLKFNIGADASYVSDLGQIINPSSGDQVLAGETTRLGTTDAWRWQATAGIKFQF